MRPAHPRRRHGPQPGVGHTGAAQALPGRRGGRGARRRRGTGCSAGHGAPGLPSCSAGFGGASSSASQAELGETAPPGGASRRDRRAGPGHGLGAGATACNGCLCVPQRVATCTSACIAGGVSVTVRVSLRDSVCVTLCPSAADGGWRTRPLTHLPEVADVEEVEGVEQLAVPEPELVVADFEEGADVLQTQELQESGEGPLGRRGGPPQRADQMPPPREGTPSPPHRPNVTSWAATHGPVPPSVQGDPAHFSLDDPGQKKTCWLSVSKE